MNCTDDECRSQDDDGVPTIGSHHLALAAADFPKATNHFFTVSVESEGTRSSIEIFVSPDRNESNTLR